MILMAHEKPDQLEPLIENATSDVRTSKVELPAHTENCKKCRGSGRFIGRNGRALGPCFACKGAGKLNFKTAPEARAKNRAASVARKAATEAENVAAFKINHPEVWAWIESNPTFGFAVAMGEVVQKYGYLTEGQEAPIWRSIEKRKAADAERAERGVGAPVVDTTGIDRLKEAFDKAIAYSAAKARGVSLRNPKITIAGMTISPAKATSTNAGALYVKQRGGEYLGKIAGGKFLAAQACTSEQRDQILRFVADPAEAAKVYGQETGVCCVCNATLTSEWRLRGIGPICGEKFGWA